MNGKQAKRLRRLAQMATVGAPDKNYEAVRHDRVVQTTRGPRVAHHHTVRLVECTRAAYQRMKADYTAGFNPEFV